jgi:pimeloyl-ACP methyl ester carboxylesterase
MHYVEAGAGPLVVLCHGFPESWYSWRHQLEPLAAAGFRAVAPDMRGYGQTDRPQPVEAYDIFQLTGDIVGLVNALGAATAVIVGHDWGAWIAAYLALLRPDLFRALVLLSVPYVPRRAMSQSEWEQQTYLGKIFYQALLRSPAAEQILEANLRASLLVSGWKIVMDPGFVPAPRVPWKPPPWITDQDLDFLEAEFRRSGFTGGLNYYRSMDRNWAMTPFLDGAKIVQPALFVAGEKDGVLEFHREEFNALETNVPNLSNKVILPGVTHWTQQENPGEINRPIVDFLKSL